MRRLAPKPLIKSLRKGLDVLRLVGESPGGLRLVEVADRLELRIPATHNLIRTLLACDFLEKRRDNRLYLGPALMDLAEQQRHSDLAVAAEREMRRVEEATPPGVVVFGIATKEEVRQLFRISSDRPHVLQRLGSDVFQPYGSASGLVGLAFADESTRMMMEDRHPFAEYGAHLWESRKALNRFLAGVKAKGYALCPFDAELFLRVSVPVFGPSRRLVGVLGVSLEMSQVKDDAARDAIVHELKQAATRFRREKERVEHGA